MSNKSWSSTIVRYFVYRKPTRHLWAKNSSLVKTATVCGLLSVHNITVKLEFKVSNAFMTLGVQEDGKQRCSKGNRRLEASTNASERCAHCGGLWEHHWHKHRRWRGSVLRLGDCFSIFLWRKSLWLRQQAPWVCDSAFFRSQLQALTWGKPYCTSNVFRIDISHCIQNTTKALWFNVMHYTECDPGYF